MVNDGNITKDTTVPLKDVCECCITKMVPVSVLECR